MGEILFMTFCRHWCRRVVAGVGMARFETLGRLCSVYMATVQANQSSDRLVGRGKLTAKVISVDKTSIARDLLPVSRADRGKHKDFAIDRQQLRDSKMTSEKK